MMQFAPLFRRTRSLALQSPRVARAMIEKLERRSLLSVAVGSAIPNTFALPGAAPTDIKLDGSFDDTSVEGLVVRLNTSLGDIDIELYDEAVRATAQNFANYVANALYNGTVIHRSVDDFIIHGGGYLPSGTHILEGPPIKNEFSSQRPNLRGTISMVTVPAVDNLGNPVVGGGPDSATSEWVINVADNPTLDASNGGFAVFGQVINGTMSVVDAINNLTIIDASAVTPIFSELPVRNVPAANPSAEDFVLINSAEVIADTRFLTLSATSDNPSIVNPVVSNGTLRLNYGTTSGSARITVTARDIAGNEASQTFVAGVGELQVQIGSGGIGQSVNFNEADGGKGSVSLTGGGTAFVRLSGENLALTTDKKPKLTGNVTGITGITTIDTGTNSTLTINSRGGDGGVNVAGISTDGPLKTLSAKSGRLSGATTIGGTVRTVALGTLTNANVVFGGSPADGIQVAMSVNTATDSNINSGMPIKSLKAGDFLQAASSPSTLTAPSIASISTRGAFQESITTTGGISRIKVGGAQRGNITADSLGSITAGSLEGGIWNFSQAFAAGRDAVGKVTVKGAIASTTIRTAGNIGSISANIITSGRFYAGVNITDEEFPPFLPVELAQFVASARISSLKVRQTTDLLSVAATTLGKISLGEVATDAPISFGLAASQIEQLTGRTAANEGDPSVPFNFRNLDDQASFDAAAAAIPLPLGNFNVLLF